MRNTLKIRGDYIFTQTGFSREEINSVKECEILFSIGVEAYDGSKYTKLIAKCDMTLIEMQDFRNWCKRNAIEIRSK